MVFLSGSKITLEKTISHSSQASIKDPGLNKILFLKKIINHPVQVLNNCSKTSTPLAKQILTLRECVLSLSFDTKPAFAIPQFYLFSLNTQNIL